MAILLCATIYTWADKDKEVQKEYCIIQGDDVNMRIQPHVKAKVIGKLGKYEFVYCIGKTEGKDKVGGDEEYWYKIRNCDNKEGWVFGKYIQYIDGTKEPDKYYKEIIYIEIVDRDFCLKGKKNKIYKLVYEQNHYIMDFEKKEKVKLADMYNEMSVGSLVFYKIIDSRLTETIHTMGDQQYFFYKDYIFIYTLKGIDVYTTKKYREKRGEPHFDIPYKYYDCTGFYLYQDILKNYDECKGKELDCDFYSNMEFNPETLEVTVNIRKEKGKLLKQEKYKFKDGNFVKVE
jgi:hypothetical protein